MCTPQCNMQPTEHACTCPASVPVMVLFWPLASSATPNRILAALLPSVGASRRYASVMYCTDVFGFFP